MIKDFVNVTESFDETIKTRFEILCLIVDDVSLSKAEARLWAKLPSFYVENRFVRIIPFKDHINYQGKSFRLTLQNEQSLGGNISTEYFER